MLFDEANRSLFVLGNLIVKKMAGAIQKNAAKIDSECGKFNTAIRGLLDQALAALAVTESTRATDVPTEDVHQGAA